MPTTFFLRWTVPAATANAIPQNRGLVLAISPEYTPIETTAGSGFEQATEVFFPSFATTAQAFPRGQRVFQFPLTLWRNYQDYAEASHNKFRHVQDLPPSDVRASLYMNASIPGVASYSWGLLNTTLKSCKCVEQVGKVLKWAYVFEGGTLEVPATTSYTATMVGTMRRFNT